MKFEIGQKVVALVNHDDIIKGKIYTVLSIHYCENCGKQAIDVGYNNEQDTYQQCNKCHYICAKWFETRWYGSNRFAPLDTNTCHDEVLEKFSSPKESPDVPVKTPQKQKS